MKSTPGENLKNVRKKLGLTQKDFAEPIGLSQTHLGSIELGKRALTDRVANDVVREYGVNKDFLLTGEGDMFLDVTQSFEIIEYVKDLCENDQEKAELVLDTYKMYLELDTKDKKVINTLLKSMLEKKHPTE